MQIFLTKSQRQQVHPNFLKADKSQYKHFKITMSRYKLFEILTTLAKQPQPPKEKKNITCQSRI